MGKLFELIVGFCVMLALVGGAIYGYIANVYSLVTNVEPVGLVIGRAIGIFFAPLGIILGYI